MRMKKFIRCDWDRYYPSGGLMGNISESFDSLEEAKAFEPEYQCDFSEVVDRDTWEVVWEVSRY